MLLFAVPIAHAAESDQQPNIRETLIQKACAGMFKLNDIQNLNADLNLDGIVNVADATLIQKKIAGIK